MPAALQSPERAQCIAFFEQLLRQEVASKTPDVARLSIALGALELSLTPKDKSKQHWPENLPGIVSQLVEVLNAWVVELASSPALLAAPSPAAKVKAIADAVWGKLNKGSYSKDLQHAQHVYNFAALLLPGAVPVAKKQLDCAGVVTTTYAICHTLNRHTEQHAELAAARMQTSEDHCWIQLDAGGSREGSVEVTTDSAAKRGLPVALDAWAGWLYTGGHAVLCSPHQALAALVTSLNPTIAGGKKGSDSEELQVVQQRLLELIQELQPDALYPAALCALADLKEVAAQDALVAVRDSGDGVELANLLQHGPNDAQELFERAIQLASGSTCTPGCSNSADNGSASVMEAARAVLQPAGSILGEGSRLSGAGLGADAAAQQPLNLALLNGAAAGAAPVLQREQEQQHSQQQQQQGKEQQEQLCIQEPQQPQLQGQQQGDIGSKWQNCNQQEEFGHQWYVYSYLSGFLARRAQFLASCADSYGEQYWAAAGQTYMDALRAASRGAPVLARYRFSPSTDEQLHKDVEAVLDEVFREGLTVLAKRQPGGQLREPAALACLLLLWDGVCHLFSGKAKPSSWVALLMKVAKLFTPEAREAAAAEVEGRVSSGPMVAARQLWRELKPVPLKPLFESADVVADSSGPGDRAPKRQRR